MAAGASLATLEAISKEIYEKELRDQLNNDNVALNRFKKTSNGTGQDMGGKYVVFPIHTGRNNGIGARAEGERLPDAGSQKTEVARLGLKYQYGAVKLTGQAIELINTNVQAFTSAVDMELSRIRQDLSKDLNRQIYGDGSGTIGVVVSISGNNVVVKTSQWFVEGMLVDVVVPATGVLKHTKLEVVSINDDGITITLSGPATGAVAGDAITRFGNWKREWTGFGAIINDTGTLYGINPVNTPVWKSTISNNGGVSTAVSEGMFDEHVDKIRKRGSGLPSVILTTPGVRREYAHLLQQQRQFVNTTDMKGGYSGITYVTDAGAIPFVTDYDCPAGEALFVKEDHIKRYQHNDWSWMDRGGNKWNQIPGYDVWEARLYQYSELGTDRRNAHGKITNITEG